MITRPEKKLFPKILLLVIAIALLIFLNQKGYLNPAKNFLASVFTFGSKNARNTALESRLTLGTFFSLGEIKKTNQKVAELELNLKTARLEKEELQKENATLRDQLELLPRQKFNLLGADVIAQDPASFEEFIVINRGEKDGLKKEMPVIISDRILIGRVWEVEKEKAKILLSVSPLNTFNAALAKDQTAESGVGASKEADKIGSIIKIRPIKGF